MVAMPAMTPMKRAAHVGELCFGGDWACAHGDLSALRYVALQLAGESHEPLHCELVELADACKYDPDRAPLLWSSLKNRLFRTSES